MKNKEGGSRVSFPNKNPIDFVRFSLIFFCNSTLSNWNKSIPQYPGRFQELQLKWKDENQKEKARFGGITRAKLQIPRTTFLPELLALSELEKQQSPQGQIYTWDDTHIFYGVLTVTLSFRMPIPSQED